MMKLVVIAHLGQDCSVKEWNGQHFAAFSVAHSDSYTDSKGVVHENTEWISCLKRVKDGNSGLLPLLKKGTKVYIEGALSKKMFDKNGQRECGLNCNVSYLELLSPKAENSVPAELKAEPNPIGSPTPPPAPPAGEGSDLPF
jgi:single-stranded DNA-binding protein